MTDIAAWPPAPEESRHIRHVLPSACAALGLPGFEARLGLPEATIAVVLVVDGLGDHQLGRHTGHARFLASAWRRAGTAQVLESPVPTTTAAAIASLATGLPPGRHGLVGYDVLAPELDRVVNMLGGWDPEVEPSSWQPYPSVLTRAEGAGAEVVTVSRPKFADSPLTQAVLSGGSFVGANRMDTRFRITWDQVEQHRPRSARTRQGPPTPLLVYLYVDELDKAGHRYGVDSPEWVRTLENLDVEAEKLASRLAERYGDQALLVMTADHGMVDVAEEHRVDITGEQDLLAGVRHTGGEPRFLHLYLDRGGGETSGGLRTLRTQSASAEQVEATAAAWERAFGDGAWVVPGRDAVEAGWFGEEVEARVLPRIGDVLVASHGPLAIYHTARTGVDAMNMVGQHGSLTAAERQVPLLSLTGQPLG